MTRKCCEAHHFQGKESCTCKCHLMLTYEQLWTRIKLNWDADYDYCNAQRNKALESIAKLHKPVMKWTGAYDYNDAELWAEQCNECSSNGFTQEYPCSTIEAIEKELT